MVEMLPVKKDGGVYIYPEMQHLPKNSTYGKVCLAKYCTSGRIADIYPDIVYSAKYPTPIRIYHI